MKWQKMRQDTAKHLRVFLRDTLANIFRTSRRVGRKFRPLFCEKIQTMIPKAGIMYGAIPIQSPASWDGALIYLKQPPVRYFTSEIITPVWQCGCGFSCTVFYRTISSACAAKYLLTPTDTLIRLYTGSSLQRYEKLLLL